MNFAMQAIDQIINSSGKHFYMSAGQINSPIVFRGPNGAAAAVAAQHSQDYAAWYGSVPGLKVIVPYDVEDARGLLKAAIRDPDPVVFLENEILYGHSFPTTPEILDKDFVLPIGKAKVMREGKDLTIVTSGRQIEHCLEVAETLAKEGVSVEVINLRTIKPLDRATVAASISKTHRVISVEEGWPQHGVGAEIISLAVEECFDDLDAPPERITGAELPTPYAPNLEALCLPQVENILGVARRVLGLK